MRKIINTKYLFSISNLFLLCNYIRAEPLLKNNIINNQYEKIYWEKVINFPVKNDLVWEKYLDSKKIKSINERFLETKEIDSKKRDNTNEIKNIIISGEVDIFSTIKPTKSDYINPIRLDTGIYVPNYLYKGEHKHTLINRSSFAGGVGGGTGNQIYSYIFDYGFNENSILSLFYSVNDDPLYELIKNKSEPIPNYWETYGFSFNRSILNKGRIDVSLGSSLEIWKVRSGDHINGNNIFNQSNNQKETTNLIGSLFIPLKYEVNNNLSAFFLTGVNFLPDIDVEYNDNKYDFYGNQVYLGWGVNYKLSEKFSLVGSTKYLLTGLNSFDSNLEFYKNNVYSFGLDYFLNPRISLESRITNAFGVTPATSNLTLPSSNKSLYYLGFSYNPWRLDSYKELSKKIINKSTSGLTVDSAKIPLQRRGLINAGIDISGNNYFSFKYPLSNKFEYDLSVMQIKKINYDSDTKILLKDKYIGNNNFHTRFGGKMTLLETDNYASGVKISFGRNQDKNSKQGHIFGEFLNSFDFSDQIKFNTSSKVFWSNIKTIYGVGLGVNYILNDKISFIPEVNVPLSKDLDPNFSFSIRYFLNNEFDIDFYISNAEGINELGSLMRSESPRIGVLINYPL
tara:strand:+ start:42371 stop:44242 length:1872 start_codon:yes stop_codon:yes gene_type:complete